MAVKNRILLVDDDRAFVDTFQQLATEADYEVAHAQCAEDALQLIDDKPFSAVVMDVILPGMSGLDALAQVKTHQPKLPVIVVTADDTTHRAIEAMRYGAYDYLVKPLDAEDILDVLENACQSHDLMSRAIHLRDDDSFLSGETMIGNSPPMQEVYKTIGRVAATDASVLVRGETGTGKELVARAVFQHSLRHEKPLITLNCAAIPETLLESQLFGHEKGSFTGATGQRIGKFEQADGGTIFLDEIGDMPTSTQTKMLRVIQNGCIERVGGSETIRVDVRIIAATNRDLEAGIEDGSFREDLYHRLNVMPIVVPPLRERREDIPDLVNYFFVYLTHKHKLRPAPLTPEAMEVLIHYDWPGNVRELQHCINRVLILSSGYPITPDDIRGVIHEVPPPQQALALVQEGPPEEHLSKLIERLLHKHSGKRKLRDIMSQCESAVLAAALRATAGNQSQAARLLGISRPSVKSKMDKYHIEPEVRVES